MAGDFRPGKTSRVIFDGTTVRVHRFRVRDMMRIRDATTWNGAGAAQYRPSGIIKTDLEIGFNVDFLAAGFPFGLSGMKPGKVTTLLYIYLVSSIGISSYNGTAICEEIDIDAEVRGIVKGVWKGKFSGTITRPTN